MRLRVVDYVVLAEGSVAAGSLRPRLGTVPFAAAIAPALSDVRFGPATVGGCAVAAEVRQRYEFRLAR